MSDEENEEEANFRQDEEADDDDDEEEDEDYDEVVLKPRPLNEVTSLTDRTSPWTSIMSDPDLVSLESLEAADEPHLSEDEDDKREMVNLETRDSSTRLDENQHHHSFSGSESDVSVTEGDEERTLQALDERRAKKHNVSNEESDDTDLSPTTEHAGESHNASGFPDNPDAQLQPYP